MIVPMIDLVGSAIFLLHSPTATWFQGQFFPAHSTLTSTTVSPTATFGLLCTCRELDACVSCSENGYRELDAKLINYKTKETIYTSAVTTGGDMLRVRTMDDDITANATANTNANAYGVKFDASSLTTDGRAVPILRAFFSNVLSKAFDGVIPEDDGEIENFMDEVVVVKGEMSLRIPTSFFRSNIGEDDNLWDDTDSES
ncbi:hypothetical protein ScalyP_jg3233 [Parmales sp. scaly parma]|nr:hypothetical protein ScalyP_jg3233 [Parmales sp. scaly parma]